MRGLQIAFLKGSNSSCRQHARKHWEVYKKKGKDADIPTHHWAIPRPIGKGQKSDKKGQQKLDSRFEKLTGPREFMHDGILHVVAQFVACDDQVGFHCADVIAC
jgi:hypothetical protein